MKWLADVALIAVAGIPVWAFLYCAITDRSRGPLESTPWRRQTGRKLDDELR